MYNNNPTRVPADGVFTARLSDFVKIYQLRHGIGLAGWVGPTTWGKMCDTYYITEHAYPGKGYGLTWYAAGCDRPGPGPGQYETMNNNPPPLPKPVPVPTPPAPKPKPRAHVASNPNDYFTIAVLSDTQNETSSTEDYLFEGQTSWLATHAQSNNIAMVLHVGDVVNDLSDGSQRQRAHDALNNLNGKVPYVIAAGNHDVLDYAGDNGREPHQIHSAEFNDLMSHLGSSVSGAFKPGDYRNTFYRTSVHGVNLLVLNLQYGAPDPVLNWATFIAHSYSQDHVILLTHDYLGKNGLHGCAGCKDPHTPNSENPTLNNGPAIWSKFVKVNPNVQFTFNGHVTDPYSYSHYRSDKPSNPADYTVKFLPVVNDAHRTVYQIMANYQDYFAGNGYIRLYKFYPVARRVDVSTYSDRQAKTVVDHKFTFAGPHLTGPDNQFSISNVNLLNW